MNRTTSDLRGCVARFAPAGWILGAVTVWFLIGIWWILTYRRGQPLDIDEAGYLRIALNDGHGLSIGGLRGWADSALAQPVNAPGLPALTALWFLIVPAGVVGGLALVLILAVVALAATYLLGRVVGGRRVAMTSLVVVASAPVIADYSRSYHFAIPATAAMTVSLAALGYSGRLHSTRSSALFGVSLGFTVLSRTMAIAFVPAIVLAALVGALMGSQYRRRRLANLALAVIVGVGVAATWYGENFGSVAQYLTAFGFGSRSADYGTAHPIYSPVAWIDESRQVFAYIHLPLVLLLAFGGVAAGVVLGRTWRAIGLKGTFRRIGLSPLMPSAVVVLLGVVALTSTGNKGSAFVAPLVPPLAVVSMWGWVRFASQRTHVAVLCLAAVVSLVPGLLPDSAIGVQRTVSLPVIGEVPVTDGAGTIQNYSLGGGYGVPGGPNALGGMAGGSWRLENLSTAERIRGADPAGGYVIFGFRHRLLNTNSVGLEADLHGLRMPPLGMVPPPDVVATIGGYAAYMRNGEGAGACLLLSATPGPGEIEPIVSNTAIERAARDNDFVVVGSWSLPDARRVTLWRRAATCPAPS